MLKKSYSSRSLVEAYRLQKRNNKGFVYPSLKFDRKREICPVLI